jgi:hypothetical protein
VLKILREQQGRGAARSLIKLIDQLQLCDGKKI